MKSLLKYFKYLDNEYQMHIIDSYLKVKIKVMGVGWLEMPKDAHMDPTNIIKS